MSETDLSKAHELEVKGDHLAAAGHWEAALACYRQSEGLDDSRASIYEKLIAARDALDAARSGEWHEDDMADVLAWTMRLQELGTPRLRYLHQHLSGDDKAVEALLQQVMATSDVEEEGRLLAQIEAHGARAIRVLLYYFLSLKHSREKAACE